MKFYPLLILALALPLSGCWKDQQQAVNLCASQNPYRSKYPPRTAIATPMTLCMARHGYHMDFKNSDCQIVPLPRRSPYCYTPDGFFAGASHKVEMQFVPAPAPLGTPLP